MFLTVLLLSLISATLCAEDKYLTQLVYKFIFTHEPVCGDPFHEPNWLPAMASCKVDCEPTQFLCLVSATDTNVQKCRPRELYSGHQKSLGMELDFCDCPSIESTDDYFHGPASTEDIVFWTMEHFVHTTAYPNIQPKQVFKAVSLPPAPHFVQNFSGKDRNFGRTGGILKSPENRDENLQQRELPRRIPTPVKGRQILKEQFDSEKVRELGKTLNRFSLPTPGFLHSAKTYYSSNEPLLTPPIKENFLANPENSYDRITEEQNSAAQMSQNNQKSYTEDFDQQQFRNPEETSIQAVTEEEFVPTGTRIEIVPPVPPPDTSPPLIAPSPPAPPSLFPQRNVVAQVEQENAVDYSTNCCEWALQGLCDRNWGKIRKICPKSCGSLICEDVESIKSCTRIVNVDVEECFQSRRVVRYRGLRKAKNAVEKQQLIDGIVNLNVDRSRKKSKKSKRRRSKKKKLKHKTRHF
ncbi:unnamed protein product [Caenorhabditis auriculariae]|uniref:ShKT domain-containing protein n=1 Tax=Caenorhabditis auriculariae TaxID=2777116 RepID=A0A8S1H5F1_9PELO|nr:unnamed protein product [Caenorhabditis auriculariae]